ncbi:pectate lyase [Paenibacillus peoriae]|uniref:pectate lyase family protein n=1 Tax=Paenibacillus peoriae TaxID=59893 RepID=UPI00026C58AB|nr:family 16 glycoside hydrolase [Paenibacillus peoriae]MEC0181990.1 pectate lyase [Paenibacillus peoriae]
MKSDLMKKCANVMLSSSLALSLSLPLLGNAYADGSLQASDNFEQGEAQGWKVDSGNWSVFKGGDGFTYQQSGRSEGRSVKGDASWTNYSVQADVYIDDFNGSNRVYVAGRYTDAKNFYAASLYNKKGGTLEIRKKVNGSMKTLATNKKYKLNTHTWYRVKLELSGSEIKMYVNDKLELTAKDSSLTAGAVGLVTSKASAQFDNVLVSGAASGGNTTTPPTKPEPGKDQPTPGTNDNVTLKNSYNLTGFSYGNTGGGNIAETDANYKKVYNAVDLHEALKKGSKVKVIEIMNDLDLGWNEMPSAAKLNPFSSHNAVQTHPVLKKTGVSKIYIQNLNGVTIFSAKGAKIKHAGFVIKNSSNLIFRNLEFDELWEWDEATKGNYDKNDWDYVTVEGQSSKVWIDHCTFNKAYDGLVDVKKGSNGVTISWSLFKGDDRSPNSWVTQQVNAMEADKSSYPMYAYLRSSAVGLSKEDIIDIAAGQKKAHLVGATEKAADNPNLEVTLHHNYYLDIQDRMPRLRGGNAHAYNIVIDDAGLARAKKRITSDVAKAISAKGYHFDVVGNGAISTENGAVLLEKSYLIDVFSPIRNNQKDAKKADFTGKIKAEDVIFSDKGSVFRGGSEEANSPLAPYPAKAIDFSWNGFTKLPYSYTAENPENLVAQLQGKDGAGAGKLNWSKENWLKTTYNASASKNVQAVEDSE